MTDDYILIHQLLDSLELALRHAPDDAHKLAADAVRFRAHERLIEMRQEFRGPWVPFTERRA